MTLTTQPAPAPIDFTPCERERIDAPGAIQPHGDLWAVDVTRLVVTHAALGRMEGGAIDIGAPVEELDRALDCGGALESRAKAVARCIREGTVTGPAVEPTLVKVAGGAAVLVTGGATHVLVERRVEEPDDWRNAGDGDRAVAPARKSGQGEGGVHRAAAEMSAMIREEIAFDRVMVYRFLPNWSGQVIADIKAEDQISYLGLHYPATDIPSQARDLYLLNEIREIADTLAKVVPFSPAGDSEAPDPVDMSLSVLRAVSPYHLEYMNNMGVRATLVSSIVVDGRLWGLVACHNRQPKVVPWTSRQWTIDASRELAAEIGRIQDAETARNTLRVKQLTTRIDRKIDEGRWNIRDVLDTLLTFANADGVALVVEDEAFGFGMTPPADLVPRLARRLISEGGPVASSHSLLDLNDGETWDGRVAGALVAELPAKRFTAIILFRREYIREIRWGGDPTRGAVLDSETGRLSPRTSFATWQETVRGTCRPWDAAVLTGMRRILSSGHLSDFACTIDEEIDRLHQELTHRDSLASAVMNAAISGMTLVVATDPTAAISVASTNASFQNTFDITPDECEGETFGGLLSRLGVQETIDDYDLTHAPLIAWSPTLGQRIIRLHRRKVLDSFRAARRSTWSIYVFEDFTDLYREQQALAVARDEAVRQALVKSEILANMSHELRTPLNAILGYGEMISDQILGPVGDARYSDYGVHIVEAGRHLLELVDNILDLSHAESGQRVLQFETFDLLDVAREVVDWSQSAIGSDHGKTAISVVAHLPSVPVSADRRAIRQVLINLINNAVKFSGPGSPVEVGVDIRKDGCPVMTVIDQGPGIRADRIEELFEPFRQDASAWTRQHVGVGLGLSIVRRLIELHGGTVTLKSSLGMGTKAEAILPRSRAFGLNDVTP